MDAALILDNVRIAYGSTVAVNGVSFRAPTGAITALLGPNGAGKTSILEATVGLRGLTAGNITVLGRSSRRLSSRHRAKVAVMLQEGGLPLSCTVTQALSDRARLYRDPANPHVLMERLDLNPRASIRSLSGGEFKRASLAMALVGDPELLFLDEPGAGLDPHARDVMLKLLDELRRAGKSIVLTSHMLDDVERIADRVVIMNRGVVVANGTVEDLTHEHQEAVTFTGPLHVELSSLLAALPLGSTAREVSPGRYVVSTNSEQVNASTLATITAWCAQHDVLAREMSVGRQTLDVVYRNLTA